MQPHRRQPTRLSGPWDSPGKNTGVGCHFLLQCMKVKSESEVSHVRLFAIAWTAAHQAALSMDFPDKSTGGGVIAFSMSLMKTRQMQRCPQLSFIKSENLAPHTNYLHNNWKQTFYQATYTKLNVQVICLECLVLPAQGSSLPICIHGTVTRSFFFLFTSRFSVVRPGHSLTTSGSGFPSQHTVRPCITSQQEPKSNKDGQSLLCR